MFSAHSDVVPRMIGGLFKDLLGVPGAWVVAWRWIGRVGVREATLVVIRLIDRVGVRYTLYAIGRRVKRRLGN
jgi:hypothetical protein